MKTSGIYLLNGRTTGVNTLVKNKIVCAAQSSNRWSSSENNSWNAWNVNFGNGNFNNNNKYNSYVVRAVSATDKDIQSWLIAFYDCCKRKKTSTQCTLYRLIFEEDLPLLATEVKERAYHPTVSICFCVTRPKLREVFAANFRDRIVQHWICLRLEPLFEERFQSQNNVSYNCRKNFGTQKAVQRLATQMYDVSGGYRYTAYVGRFDICSFFMSIDCTILEEMLIPFIKENYKGDDIDTLIYLVQVIVRHEPQKNCIKKGQTELFERLEHNKSLFYAEYLIGMPIGNLTSQLFANFYMSFFDEYMLRLCKRYKCKYVRFVDDFCITGRKKANILKMYRMADLYLKNKLHLTLHHDKFYLQEVKHGVKFVGSVIKYDRIYLSNRTVGSLVNRVNEAEKICKAAVIATPDEELEAYYNLDKAVCALNSYFGFLIHCNSYAIRRKLFKNCTYFWKCCYVEGKFAKVCIKNQYKLTRKLLSEE